MIFSYKLFIARKLDSLIDIANLYIFHGRLEKIIEVTYTYREIGENLYLNETLFEEYLGLTYPEYSLESLGLKYRFRVGVQILQIESLIKKSKKMIVFSRQESLRRNLFIESLEYVLRVLELSVLGLDFELEKAGIPFSYSREKQQRITEKIEEKESIIFGGKIQEIGEEFSNCYNFILEKHKKYLHKLSNEESKDMQKYLDIIKKNAPGEILAPKAPLKGIRVKGSFLRKELQRKDYRKIFDMICEIYGLPQRTELTNAGSVYDGDNSLEIPRNHAFLHLPFQRVLKLITHEIESHFINAYNGKILIGKFRGAHNLPKEEGIAMFMEKIFEGYELDTIESITEIFFPILGGECLEGEDFKGFMRITGEKYRQRRDYNASILRAKRNYSMKLAGVQHKDVVYFRGLEETVQYLKDGGEFYKLFLGKIGFHDIEDVSTIYKKSKQRDDIIFPLFFSDIIYYYLQEKEKDGGFIFDNKKFYLSLKKKYWFLDIERFKIISRLEEKQKNIQNLLQFIDKRLDME